MRGQICKPIDTIRLVATFPLRSGYNSDFVEGHRPNYPGLRDLAWRLLKAGHVADIIYASYSRLLVDEYQDCSARQHAIVYYAARLLPTCVLGDPMQAIFDFSPDDPLADWDGHVCAHFPAAGELVHPWRWTNAGAIDLGQWLLDVRKKLLTGSPIDLTEAPSSVSWISLNGTPSDYTKLLQAGRTRSPDKAGSVLILGDSTKPLSQQKFASEVPGAVTIEAVDLRDLVTFARTLDVTASNALRTVAEFAEKMMTNVGANDLVRRVDIITRGSGRKEPSEVERSAIAFQNDRTYRRVLDLLVEINKDAGVRVFRPAVQRACHRALSCAAAPKK